MHIWPVGLLQFSSAPGNSVSRLHFLCFAVSQFLGTRRGLSMARDLKDPAIQSSRQTTATLPSSSEAETTASSGPLGASMVALAPHRPRQSTRTVFAIVRDHRAPAGGCEASSASNCREGAAQSSSALTRPPRHSAQQVRDKAHNEHMGASARSRYDSIYPRCPVWSQRDPWAQRHPRELQGCLWAQGCLQGCLWAQGCLQGCLWAQGCLQGCLQDCLRLQGRL